MKCQDIPDRPSHAASSSSSSSSSSSPVRKRNTHCASERKRPTKARERDPQKRPTSSGTHSKRGLHKKNSYTSKETHKREQEKSKETYKSDLLHLADTQTWLTYNHDSNLTNFLWSDPSFLYLRQGALYLRKRALHLCKRALHHILSFFGSRTRCKLRRL